jgi:hypothetical protein
MLLATGKLGQFTPLIPTSNYPVLPFLVVPLNYNAVEVPNN